MTLKLYDLAARDDRIRFSPFCWRAKMALLHKGLEFETLPWRFTDKDMIAPTGQGRVPVLVDGERWIHDSWQIALYLDDAYPDRPALLNSEAERAAARFVNSWCDLSLHPILRPLVLIDVYTLAAQKDQAYFRESREKMLGMPLEDLRADNEKARQALLGVIAPVETTLRDSEYFGGEHPNYADYILFGSLQWARIVSSEPILDSEGAIAGWLDRMLDLFDGYARKSITARDAAAAA